MNPRQLKRIEDLLRLGLDQSTTAHERVNAITEALRVVVCVREGKTDESEWFSLIAMRRLQCFICGEEIRPLARVLRAAGTTNVAHDRCVP